MSSILNYIEEKFVNPPVAAEKLVTSPHFVPDASGAKMWACTWHGKEKMVLAEVPRPGISEPNDAIIRLTKSTICGSDLHFYFNKVPGFSPMHSGDITGHEGVGVVEKIGDNVKGVKPGDRVVISAIIACGDCWYCQQGYMSSCDRTNPSSANESLYGVRMGGIFGYTHLTGGYAGLQAEYARVPFADVNLLKLPDDVPDEKAIMLSDVACTAWHGLEMGGVTADTNSVAIWGAGPVGLLTAALALLRGANRVLLIDQDEGRLELARSRIGKVETLNATDVDVSKALHERVPGGIDVCIDCAGFRFPKSLSHTLMTVLKLETDACDIVAEMIVAARKNGRCVLIGDYFATTHSFPIGAFMEKGLSMAGGQVFVQKYWRTLLGLIREGRFDPTFIVTHRMPFGKAVEAYDKFAHHRDGAVKILLDCNEAERAALSASAPASSSGPAPVPATGEGSAAATAVAAVTSPL
eukprot:tig00000403_g333.t1